MFHEDYRNAIDVQKLRIIIVINENNLKKSSIIIL